MSLAATWDDLAAGLAREPVVPAAPKPATEVLPLVAHASCSCAATRSPPGASPPTSYDIFSRPFMGRTSFLVNHPDGDPAGAGRQPRQLRPHARHHPHPAADPRRRPVPGRGQLPGSTSGGPWRRPSPRAASTSRPRHIARVAEETVAELAAPRHRGRRSAAGRAAPGAGGRRPLLLLAGHGRARRRRCAPPSSATAHGLARPSFLDFLLPAEAPSPLDAARWWFARDFKRVLDRMIAERCAHPAAGPAARPVRRAGRPPATRRPARASRPTQLRDQIATLAVAGHETTALTMFWAGLPAVPRARRCRSGWRRRPRAVDLSPDARARGHGAAAADQGRGAGGAAPLPAGLHHRPDGAWAPTRSSARTCPRAASS